MFRILAKPEDSKLAELSLKQREQLFSYRHTTWNSMTALQQSIHEVESHPFRSRAVHSESPKREGRLRSITE